MASCRSWWMINPYPNPFSGRSKATESTETLYKKFSSIHKAFSFYSDTNGEREDQRGKGEPKWEAVDEKTSGTAD